MKPTTEELIKELTLYENDSAKYWYIEQRLKGRLDVYRLVYDLDISLTQDEAYFIEDEITKIEEVLK